MKLLLLLLPILLSSCATLKQPQVIGTIAGTLAGAALGYGVPAPNKNIPKSIMFGGSFGGGFGWLLGKVTENDNASRLSKLNDINNNGESINELPNLSEPTVKRIWIPDKIEGDQYIKGHYIYVIEQKPFWKKDKEESPATDHSKQGLNNEDPELGGTDQRSER